MDEALIVEVDEPLRFGIEGELVAFVINFGYTLEEFRRRGKSSRPARRASGASISSTFCRVGLVLAPATP